MRIVVTFLTAVLFLSSCKSETKQEQESITRENAPSTLEQTDSQADSVEVEITPISHATAVIRMDDKNIYIDPTGGAEAFEGMVAPDVVLVTDIHGDHMSSETLEALDLEGVKIIVPQAVKEQLSERLQPNLMVMENGETLEEQGISIEAIPMYNLREEAKQFHEKGRGNGYLLEKEGTRVYIAGDTEDIPEMRNLEDIDIALVPMNLPYTMTVESAADAVLEFAPKQVYPYHFRGTEGKADVEKFKQLVNEGDPNIEVVIVEWYPTEDA